MTFSPIYIWTFYLYQSKRALSSQDPEYLSSIWVFVCEYLTLSLQVFHPSGYWQCDIDIHALCTFLFINVRLCRLHPGSPPWLTEIWSISISWFYDQLCWSFNCHMDPIPEWKRSTSPPWRIPRSFSSFSIMTKYHYHSIHSNQI